MYEFVVHAEAVDQIVALPDDALDGYADAMTVLQLVPWNGPPINKANPSGAVRVLAAKQGLVTYLVLEEQQRVDVLRVLWLG